MRKVFSEIVFNRQPETHRQKRGGLHAACNADNKPEIEILSISAMEAQFLELFNLAASRCVLLPAGRAQSGFLNSEAFLFSAYRDYTYLNYLYKRWKRSEDWCG